MIFITFQSFGMLHPNTSAVSSLLEDEPAKMRSRRRGRRWRRAEDMVSDDAEQKTRPIEEILLPLGGSGCGVGGLGCKANDLDEQKTRSSTGSA